MMASKIISSQPWRCNMLSTASYTRVPANCFIRCGITLDGRRLLPSEATSTPTLRSHSTSTNITDNRSPWINNRLTSYPISHSLNSIHHANNSKRSMSSFLFGRKYQQPWHDPEFMQDSPPEDVEKWLLSLIQSTRRNAEQKRVRSSADHSSNKPIVYFEKDFVLDAQAFLRVLEAYARKQGGGGSPQKAEYWLGLLERHYSAAVELFHETYGIHADTIVGGEHVVTYDVSVDEPRMDKIDESYLKKTPFASPRKDSRDGGVNQKSKGIHMADGVGDLNMKSSFASLIKPSKMIDAVDESQSKPSSFAALIKQNKAQQRTSHPIKQSKRKVSTTIPTPQQLESQYSGNVQRDNAAEIVRNLQPTVECYNALIEAWSYDKDVISVVRSRRWLTKLEDESEKPHDGSVLWTALAPNAQSYDHYMQSLSRGLGKHPKVHRERAEEAEDLLNYRLSPDAPLAIRPTTESFNYVLRAWTRCRKDIEVAGKVMSLILSMEKFQKEALLAQEKGLGSGGGELSWKSNLAPNTKTYAMALDAWVIKASLKAQKWRSKERTHQNIMIQKGMLWDSSSCGGDARNEDGTKEMEKAETILKYINDLSMVGMGDVRATNIAYNTLLSGWARLANELRPDIPLKAEKIVHDMIANAEQGNENAAPDVRSFNAIINAWGNIKQANSADRCEYWLRKMVRESQLDYPGEKNFIAAPDVSTYNLVMDAHIQQGNPQRAEAMIHEMNSSGNISPNNESFSKVIRAWLQDELNNQNIVPGSSLEGAFNWLNELLDRERNDEDGLLGPAPDLFHAILKTAARSDANGERVLIIALKTFEAVEESRFQSDHLAYSWLLEVALKVLSSPKHDERRTDVIKSIFEQCITDGLLSAKFCRVIANGPFQKEQGGWTRQESERMRQQLFGEPPFPTTWSRNLKNGQNQQPQPSDLIQTVSPHN